LAFSTTSFHFPQSWMQTIQFLTLIWQIYCLMLSSHLYLGLPCDLLVRGFHLNIFLTVLVSCILCTWPNQLSILSLIPVVNYISMFYQFIQLFIGFDSPYLIFSWRLTISGLLILSAPRFLRHMSILVLLQFYIQWTLELRPAWHMNNLGYDQNFSFDLQPKSWVMTRMPVKAKTCIHLCGCKQRPKMHL
jgi:hypothetical protein